jgi:transcriptional regulator with XRE-family HTH domain
MKYGPTSQRRFTEEVYRLRTEEKLSGPEIADRLGLTIGWVNHKLVKMGLSKRLSVVGSRENLTRAAELRAAGVRWKLIAKELGIEKWESLARAVYTSKPIAP